MPLELILIGIDPALAEDFELLSAKFNMSVWKVARIEDVAGLENGSETVAIVDHQSDANTRALRASLTQAGLSSDMVTVLEREDYTSAIAAFRAGVVDVLIQSAARAEIENLLQRLRVRYSKRVHPDAILPLEEVERSAITAALDACSGQVSKTARKLGIGRSTLYRKMEQYGLHGLRLKDPA